MKTFLIIAAILFSFVTGLHTGSDGGNSHEKVFPGADEHTPSRAQYFSWINNTNEGATQAHTMINLDFFQWLHDQYGMVLDIYAFDAGAIDGKRFYGRTDSSRFKSQFPNGFAPIYKRALKMKTRLGVWGGPDGFGDSPKDAQARIDQMVALCKDYKFALFKFDAVCGPLRQEKEHYFIDMMKKCRQYSPDLILLNHRLGLRKAKPYATTFLWEGKETYIDVFSTNSMTAPHHRADALSRGLPPNLQRLTEDHGVCLSSCLDYWDDDLVLQAFNRNLILSPQIYANPWLLRDDEFPKLARIYNLHRSYRHIMVNGLILPENTCGPHAVSRGDSHTRLITLRNLTWEPVTYSLPLDNTIGLSSKERIHCRQFHPTERILGDFTKSQKLPVTVPPFRSCLILATTRPCNEPGIIGVDYEVIRNIPGKPVLIKLKAMPGSTAKIKLAEGNSLIKNFKTAQLDNRPANALLKGKFLTVRFSGTPIKEKIHRKLAGLSPANVPRHAEALYEATVFAADNNALELRSLKRSGPTRIPQVKKARDAFFQQAVFAERGISDRNLFDNDMSTGFWPSRKYRKEQRVNKGCFRLDLGKITDLDQIVLHVPGDYSLQPLLTGEGNHVDVSTDLRTWERITYLAGKKMSIHLKKPVRYLRFRFYPDRIVEIQGFKNGKALPRKHWRASNLFAHPSTLQPVNAWHAQVKINQYVQNSYLCIAIEGKHGIEGAYAAIEFDNTLTGCPDRAPSYPSNTWEYINAKRGKNYTYYVPITKNMIDKPINVHVLGFHKEHTTLKPTAWLSTYPIPYKEKLLRLNR